MSHTLLGPIVRCQVTARALIQDGRYIPSDIVPADTLHLSPDGVVGWCDGRAIINHHHRLHPHRRVWKPNRMLSVGFTSHYQAMSDRFGHAELGCAAENIVVDADRIITADDLASGMQLRTADGEPIVDLEPAAVAKPCVPFTRYLLEDEDAGDETVAPHRAFLDGGMRGFVLGLTDLDPEADPIRVAPGDQLWLVSP